MSLIEFLFQKISSLFTSSSPKITKEMFSSTPNLDTKDEITVNDKPKNNTFLKIAKEELEKYPYFKKDKNDILMAYLIDNVQIKGTNILTVDEKKKLNINTKYKVSQEMLDFFDMEAIESDKFLTKHPKDFFSDLYNRVFFKVSKIRDIKNMKKIGIKEVKFKIIGGRNKPCKWCISQNNKMFKIDNIIEIIDNNCSCAYNNIDLSAEDYLEKLLK